MGHTNFGTFEFANSILWYSEELLSRVDISAGWQPAGTARRVRRMRYVFAECILDTRLYTLHREGTPVRLRPKAFQVLQYLLEQRDHVVTKDELCAQVWPGQFISDATLEGCITLARRAIGDSGRVQRLIESRRGYGYRFVGTVQEVAVSRPDREAVAAVPGMPSVSPQAPVQRQAVGREAELGHLHRWLDTALTGARQMVFVTGEAGLGKTTLVKVDSLAHVLWLLGYPEQARQRGHEALTLAQAHEPLHSFTLAHVANLIAVVHHLRREARLAQERAEVARRLSSEHGFAGELGRGTILQGWALVVQGNGEGFVQMRQGLAAYQATGAELWRPYYLALLAEAYGKGGQLAQGLRLLSEALALIDNSGEGWWEAELHRLRGEFVLGQEDTRHTAVDAEECFQQARAVAQQQQAKSLELRAAMSLSRLWQAHDKRAAARHMLAEIYGWFTEGFDTADLQGARVLLAKLT
jgi:DNA-binding winged helix-turn-helix (wHTH) protein